MGALEIAQLARATRKRWNHPEDRVLRVATRDCHVEAVQPLPENVHDAWGKFPNVLVLESS